MSRFLAIALAMLISGAAPAFADSQTAGASGGSILEIGTFDDLLEHFCHADQRSELIVVLPASLFVDAMELVCPHGPFKMYRIQEHNDPDDFEYYLDPPFGAKTTLACDGKAGVAMKVIAVNCRPLE